MTKEERKQAALAKVAELAAAATKARSEFDKAIRTAQKAGASVREIEPVSGLSRSRVDQIIRGV